MKRAFAITGICVFACAAMLGFLLTALVPMGPESWWFWPVARVIWQVGGGVWCGLGVAILAGQGHAKLGMGVGLLGLVLAINPVLDLFRGPVEGLLLDCGTTRQAAYGPSGSGAGISPRGQSIHGTLLLQTAEEDTLRIEPMGAQANRMEDLCGACPAGGQVQALRHLDVVLAVRCQE